MAREHWVVTPDGTEVSGPYTSEQDAHAEKRDRQPGYDEVLSVTNTDDAY